MPYKIQKKFPKRKTVQTEFKYSLLTMVIFSIIIFASIVIAKLGYTRMYFNIHAHSIFYFIVSILLTILLHDTYFYWTHRLMHWKKIFPYVHRIHHLSHNPTPLAAYSFHPVEAFIEVGIVPLAIFIIPLHPIALGIFGLYMIVLNIMGHLGYELFPQKFLRNKWVNWQNTSTHHNIHHHYNKCNYSLYFNWWDKIMGTNHPQYQQHFETTKQDEKVTKLPLAETNKN